MIGGPRSRIRRARGFVTVIGGLVTVVACGTSVQPASPIPSAGVPPDVLVAIDGGRHLEIRCSGSGPVVVLDAGLGNTLDVWSAMRSRIRSAATVCAYNRASLGRSEARPAPHGAASAVDDLHALLAAAHLAPPDVVVGASFGGLDAQLFARRYPAETAGVVLVDAIAPGWDRQLETILTPDQVAARRAIPDADLNDWFLVDPGSGAASGIAWLHGVPFPIAYSPDV